MRNRLDPDNANLKGVLENLVAENVDVAIRYGGGKYVGFQTIEIDSGATGTNIFALSAGNVRVDGSATGVTVDYRGVLTVNGSASMVMVSSGGEIVVGGSGSVSGPRDPAGLC